jgi:hypothetical protein
MDQNISTMLLLCPSHPPHVVGTFLIIFKVVLLLRSSLCHLLEPLYSGSFFILW